MGEQKNAIVTGAASGLGRALAVALGRRGWWIALADVNTAGCEETLGLVRQAGGEGFVEELDVRHIEEWEALRDRLKARWDNLDLLANNVTKAGMLALSETLYSELMPYNVGVTAICPAVFRTNLLDNARWCREEERTLFLRGFEQAKMTADDVAKAALHAMDRKQLYLLVPFESRMNW